MINKRALKKACYFGLTFANASVGSAYLFGQLCIDFNITVGFIYFIISMGCIILAYCDYEN